MNGNKPWLSALTDFVVTFGTAFIAWPDDETLTVRAVVTMAIGASVATAKGMRTYWATHPGKEESEKG